MIELHRSLRVAIYYMIECNVLQAHMYIVHLVFVLFVLLFVSALYFCKYIAAQFKSCIAIYDRMKCPLELLCMKLTCLFQLCDKEYRQASDTDNCMNNILKSA